MEHHTTIDEVAALINAGFTDVTNHIGEVKQGTAENQAATGPDRAPAPEVTITH